MIRRQLGQGGPELSAVGVGAWAIGGGEAGMRWPGSDDDLSVRTIHQALEEGYNWVDTAAVYGYGHSEEIVGRALSDRRDQAIIATKCTSLWDAEGVRRQSGVPDSIRVECEQSLARLSVDYIDLYQIHGPPPDVPVEETWGELCRLQDAGKVRFIGVSNFDVPQLKACMSVRQVQSLQPQYNLLARHVEAEILPYCLENGIGVIPYGPISEGLLSGSFDFARLPQGDWRRSDQLQSMWPDVSALVETLRPLATRRGWTVGQLAIAWVVSHPAVTSAIVGARRPAQVTENALPVRASVDASLRTEVEAALAARAASSDG